MSRECRSGFHESATTPVRHQAAPRSSFGARARACVPDFVYARIRIRGLWRHQTDCSSCFTATATVTATVTRDVNGPPVTARSPVTRSGRASNDRVKQCPRASRPILGLWGVPLLLVQLQYHAWSWNARTRSRNKREASRMPSTTRFHLAQAQQVASSLHVITYNRACTKTHRHTDVSAECKLLLFDTN